MAVEGAVSDRGKPDPNVQLPPAVRRAAERSEELAKQAAEARRNAPPNANEPLRIANPPSNGQGNGQSNVVMADFDPRNPNPPGENQLSVVASRPEPPRTLQLPSSQPPQPQSQPQPQLQLQHQTSQPQPQNNEPVDYEHQFRSLQGRYSKAEQDARRMAGQIQDMQRLIASMSAPPSTQQPQQGFQPPPQEGSGVRFTGPITGRPPARRLTEKEIAEYGADLIDVMGRRAMEVADVVVPTALSDVSGRLARLEQQLGNVRQTVAYDGQSRMYDTLGREIPDWNQINNSPEFVRWLGMPDPLSGQIRHNMLIEAFNGQQTNRVIEFFRRYMADQAPSGLQSQGSQPGLTINGGSAPQVDLMALAAPGRAKPGQTQVTPEKPIINRSDISTFYREKAMGRYAGRDEEVSRFEQEIFAASREGRIR